MFIEARQLTRQPGHQEIDEAIEYATGTSQDFKQGFKKAAPTPWTLSWKELAITAITIIIIL